MTKDPRDLDVRAAFLRSRLPPEVTERLDALDRFRRDLGLRCDKYILNHQGEPEPCPDLLKWGLWFESAERRVCADLDEGNEQDGTRVYVSTVFLGLDHSFGDGPPVLWETMVFGGVLDGEQRRYTSLEAALEGHQDICVEVARTIERREERR
jgi:hypothetical protein